ncbi:DUF6624 domain-containing protein [Pedobacter deserti]|uniref:DUF6624 domain-containing protein n=1 Tax=Pedobacter deserti TaxID=2817382 RepID=UPI002109663B|nr:DUF6624 domain-containing protein [Pedobacter sp. SYSU D00382]
MDQKYRSALSALYEEGNADSIGAVFGRSSKDLFMVLLAEMKQVDSSNLIEVDGIIKTYGYPGRSLVGTPTNEAAWHVIQYSPRIKNYIKVVQKAARQKQLSFELYCKMVDRMLMEEGREQIYGTQISGLAVADSSTGKTEWRMFVWPIRNAAKVDKLRKRAGFLQSIQEYAASFGVVYSPFTLRDVEHLKRLE